MKNLTVIRPLNLLLIALGQVLIHYTFFETLDMPLALGHGEFLLLLLATLLIAAGGNLVNDIADQETDAVNKPDKLLVGRSISVKKAYNLYMLLTTLGVLTGLFLSRMLEKPGLAGIFVLIAALLYLYSSQLKGMMVVGNVLVSLLVAASLLIVPVFDLYPVAQGQLEPQALNAAAVVFHLSVFAFGVNLAREIVKDIEDVNGDRKGGYNTLPIALGRKTAGRIVLALLFIILVALLCYANRYLYPSFWLLIYSVLVLSPLLVYICTRLWIAKGQDDYHRLSRLLKMAMLLGLLAIPLLKLLLV